MQEEEEQVPTEEQAAPLPPMTEEEREALRDKFRKAGIKIREVSVITPEESARMTEAYINADRPEV